MPGFAKLTLYAFSTLSDMSLLTPVDREYVHKLTVLKSAFCDVTRCIHAYLVTKVYIHYSTV